MDTSAFIEWERCDYNRGTDHAANVALDLGADWAREENDAGLDKDQCNVSLCVDGARRGDASSFGGTAIFAYLVDAMFRYCTFCAC